VPAAPAQDKKAEELFRKMEKPDRHGLWGGVKL
jgi:hypothetical protein